MLGLFLSALGRRGPPLLVALLVVGLSFPALAQAGYALLPIAAFLLTLGSLLTAGMSAPETKARLGVVVAGLVWIGVILPLLAAALLLWAPLDAGLRSGILLSLLAPPVGSAAAIAAMIGLQPRLALAVSLTLTLLAPLSMPIGAFGFGLGASFHVALAVRLLAIMGAAAAVAGVALKWRARAAVLIPDQQAATGVAVVGLVIVGLATMYEVHARGSAARFEAMLIAATAVNFGLCALSTLIFSSLGLSAAGTLGLLSGNRNVTLAWAAASYSLPATAETYVAACVVPVLILPVIIRTALSIWRTLLSAKLPIPAAKSGSRS